MRDIVTILKALSDENRMRILKLLENRNLCVCELEVLLNLSQPAVSHHLKVLYNAGLVDFEKEGLFVNYRLTDGAAPEVENLRRVLLEALAGKEKVVEDLGKVEGIDREKICSDKK